MLQDSVRQFREERASRRLSAGLVGPSKEDLDRSGTPTIRGVGKVEKFFFEDGKYDLMIDVNGGPKIKLFSRHQASHSELKASGLKVGSTVRFDAMPISIEDEIIVAGYVIIYSLDAFEAQEAVLEVSTVLDNGDVTSGRLTITPEPAGIGHGLLQIVRDGSRLRFVPLPDAPEND